MAKTNKERVFWVRKVKCFCGDKTCTLQYVFIYRTQKDAINGGDKLGSKNCYLEFLKITGIKLRINQIKKVKMVEVG